MIRFDCSKCGRPYELPNAMAHLRLLCKGCGQPLAVPEAQPDPEPEPEPPPPPKAIPKPAAIAPKPNAPDDDDDEKPFLIAEPDGSPHVDFDIPGQTAASASDAMRKRLSVQEMELPPLPTAPAKPPSQSLAAPAAPRKWFYTAVDVAVGLVVVVVGVLLGEMLAKKSTGQVLGDAGSAPKFPPMDLIQWLGPPLMLGLIYGLLISRGISVGNWLKRRAEA